MNLCVNPNCGVELPDNSNFCHRCKQRQPKPAPVSSNVSAPSKNISIGDRAVKVLVGFRLFNFRAGNITFNITSGPPAGLSILVVVVFAVFWLVSTGDTRCALFASGQPPGSGSVLMDPLQGSDNKYECGTKVTVQAVPTDGWLFQRWVGVGGAEALNPVVVVIDSDKQVLALFSNQRP